MKMMKLRLIRGLRFRRWSAIFILVPVILSSHVSIQMFTRFDGTDVAMISLKDAKSNHDGYALSATDSLSAKKNGLVNT